MADEALKKQGMTEVKCIPTKKIGEVFFENLFNDPRHVLMQGGEALTYNLYFNHILSGSIHFVIEDKTAYSPLKSLFGGFEIHKKVTPEALRAFYLEVEKDLYERKVKKVIITLPANFYRKARVKVMKKVLEEAGFSRLLKCKNHSIEIRERSLSSLIHPMEKRKLSKCNDFGLEFFKEPADMLPVVYEFIHLCRKEKKHPLSINFERLSKSFELFPENYFIFSVKKNNEIYAATIGVKVNDKVIYNFLPASPAKFNDLSPTVKLIDGMYSYAYKKKFKFLDLGISTTPEGKNQKTLIEFKKHMGGQKSSKQKFGKMLDESEYWYA